LYDVNHYCLVEPMLQKSHAVVLCTSEYEINAVVKFTYLTCTNAWIISVMDSMNANLQHSCWTHMMWVKC